MMLKLTDQAQKQFTAAMEQGELGPSRVRVFIDHRCHCGKAHFSLGLDKDVPPDGHTPFEVEGVPFVADVETAKELPSVEIDFVENVWTKGFTIRNTDHDCGAHMMK
jgi:Fe-S cluster assembly iron-binding protein IscA